MKVSIEILCNQNESWKQNQALHVLIFNDINYVMLILCIDKPHIKKFRGKDIVNYNFRLSLQALRTKYHTLA